GEDLIPVMRGGRGTRRAEDARGDVGVEFECAEDTGGHPILELFQPEGGLVRRWSAAARGCPFPAAVSGAGLVHERPWPLGEVIHGIRSIAAERSARKKDGQPLSARRPSAEGVSGR